MSFVLHVWVQNAAANDLQSFLMGFIKCRVTRHLWSWLTG